MIVTETEPPVVRDIDFEFACNEPANKFICTNDPDPLHRYVDVTVTVTDSDTPCDEIAATWSSDPNNPNHPLIVGTSRMTLSDGTEQCLFTAILDSHAPNGDYTVTLTLNDGHFTVPFSFPVHLVTCRVPAAVIPELVSETTAARSRVERDSGRSSRLASEGEGNGSGLASALEDVHERDVSRCAPRRSR